MMMSPMILVVGDEKQPVEAENLVDAGHNEDQEEAFLMAQAAHEIVGEKGWNMKSNLKTLCHQRGIFSNGLVVLPNDDEEWWKMFSAEISVQFKVDVAYMSLALVEMLQETKRLTDLKVAKDKSEEALRIITPTRRKVQEQKLAETVNKRIQQLNKSMEEYLKCIEFIDEQQRITKFKYQVRKSTKIATMNITRNNQPLNYKIYKQFRLKMLEFTE
ncbi:hypothetical protein Tco_1016566 [Tanacetum coccineum]|uniref:Uncharacterized protein n=1 Tax=Tanacetum coccineum TaxID=301880 RepID=A0ABQ5FP43_9ASTR